MTVTYVQAVDVLSRRTFDRVIVLVPGREELLHLDGTAVAVWECLATPMSIDDAARHLAEVYASDAGRIGADLAATVEDLVARGAVVRIP